MGARPVARRAGPDRERHPETLPGVEFCSPYLREVPVGAQVARAHLGIRLETAAREHHGIRVQRIRAPTGGTLHSGDTATVEHEIERMRVVADFYSGLRRRAVVRIEQPWAPAPDFARQPAPELVTAVHLDSLAAVAHLEAHSLL